MSKQQPSTNGQVVIPTYSELPRVQTKGSLISVGGNLYISDGLSWQVAFASGRNLLDYEDWTTFRLSGPGAKWTAFDPTRMDATVTNATGKLTLNETPQSFTLAPIASTLSHITYLCYRNGPDLIRSSGAGASPTARGAYSAPDDGSELVFETSIAVSQYLPIGSAFVPAVAAEITDYKTDIRTGAGSFACLDEETYIVYDIFAVEGEFFVVEERLPFGRPSFGGSQATEYAAYTTIHPLCKRGGNRDPSNPVDMLQQFAKVAICYNRSRGYIRFLVEGEEKLRLDKIGIPPTFGRVLDEGGAAAVVAPRQFRPGFGIFTLMDASPILASPGSTTQGIVRLNPAIPPFNYYNTTQYDVEGNFVAQTFASTTLTDCYATPAAQGISMSLLPLSIYTQQVVTQ